MAAKKKDGPSGPRTSTIKLLCLASGNECAFTGCTEALMAGRVVLGEIAHIKGEKVGSKRHDPSQSNEDRHGFDNLIMLCPKDHTRIDSDAEWQKYPPEVLRAMKAEHEKNAKPMPDPSDDVINGFLAKIDVKVEGDVVFAKVAGDYVQGDKVGSAVGGVTATNVFINQGHADQFAQNIFNLKEPDRRIPRIPGERFIELLKTMPPENFDVAWDGIDQECDRTKDLVCTVLIMGGWTKGMITQAFAGNITPGIEVGLPRPSAAATEFVNFLQSVGIAARVAETRHDGRTKLPDTIEIRVGIRPRK
jgi:hypothetical protein